MSTNEKSVPSLGPTLLDVARSGCLHIEFAETQNSRENKAEDLGH